MQYDYEDFGNGIAVPCARVDLTGNGSPAARRRLAAELFPLVDRAGALLFRDTGLTTPHQFGEFLESIDFLPHSYVGGTSPRTAYGAGIYTATDLPPNVTIHIHQEMAYLDDVPDYVAFFCQDPPENEQKTNLVGDMRRMTASLPASLKRRYRGQRARLRRTLPPEGMSTGFYKAKKSWQETLGTADRQEALAVARQRGWELRWTDDDYLVITQEPARFFRSHPVHGELWCTQALLHQPEWRRLVAEHDGRTAEARQLAEAMAGAPESLDGMILEDGSTIPTEDARIWFELSAQLGTPYALGRGEVIFLDNMLTGHGRSTFTGPRRMFVALGDRPGHAAANQAKDR